MFRTRDLLYRESAAGLYKRPVAVVAYLLVELPYIAVFTLAFTGIFYFMLGFRNDAAAFWMFWLVTMMVATIYQYAGIMLAGLLQSIVLSQVLGGVSLSVYFLFGGVFISPQYIIKYWKWFYWVDFESWAVRALTMSQFYCNAAVEVCTQIAVPTPTSMVTMGRYEFLADSLEFSYDDRWAAVGVLAGMLFLYAAVAVGVYQVFNYLKR